MKYDKKVDKNVFIIKRDAPCLYRVSECDKNETKQETKDISKKIIAENVQIW